MTAAGRDLAGARILVVEDEMLISMLVEDMLIELGCAVVGPAPRVAVALALVGREAIDGALLDVNVAGETVFPVAEALAGRGIPFVFVTGYGAAGLPESFRDRPVLQKPFQEPELRRALAGCLGPG